MQRRRALVAAICVCAATPTAALAAPRRCEPAKPDDLRRAQLAAAAAAALPAKPASAAPPAPEVATDRKGVPISKATWEASHTPGAADLVAGLGGEPTLLLSGENGALEPFALQAECTHLGCLVGPWNPLSQRFVCPCHGSELSGNQPVNLPATSRRWRGAPEMISTQAANTSATAPSRGARRRGP